VAALKEALGTADSIDANAEYSRDMVENLSQPSFMFLIYPSITSSADEFGTTINLDSIRERTCIHIITLHETGDSYIYTASDASGWRTGFMWCGTPV
jgi:hypothetical protein